MNSVTLRLPQLQADLLHSSLTPLHTSPYAPTIMGPFSYVPMECVHSIISLRHTVSGTIRIPSCSASSRDKSAVLSIKI